MKLSDFAKQGYILYTKYTQTKEIMAQIDTNQLSQSSDKNYLPFVTHDTISANIDHDSQKYQIWQYLDNHTNKYITEKDNLTDILNYIKNM